MKTHVTGYSDHPSSSKVVRYAYNLLQTTDAWSGSTQEMQMGMV